MFIKIKTLESENGTVDISASGIEAKSCPDLPFSKSGQDMKISDKMQCLGNVQVTAKYCSDSDTIAVTVAVASIPGITIDATAKNVPCP